MQKRQLHSELKKEFQLERLILFSDAVFAIAITLLVLEIRIPDDPRFDRHTATDAVLLHFLDDMIPRFIGFFVSFFIIGLYWTIHHRMFGFVVNYTRRLIWLNLLFLLAVVLMPFSTGFYSNYILKLLKTPVIIYVVNIVFLGLMNLLIWRHITNPRLQLTDGLDKEERAYFTFRAVTVPVVFITTAAIYLFVAPRVAVWIPLMIPVLMRILRHHYRKYLLRKTV